MSVTGRVAVLVLGLLAVLALEPRQAEARRRTLADPVDQLLQADTPFAIAHRGFGENLGEDPSRPIENTVRAVRQGFRAGARVVEVDVQLTADGWVVAHHDDFLDDFTCINTLTFAELKQRLPHVPSLRRVLRVARSFNAGALPPGVLIVELKAPSPLCDRDDIWERAIASAVVRVIRHARMSQDVLITSLSPALLSLAAEEAPEIRRGLTISGLQFLSADEIQALLGLPVTLIDKEDLGLQWAEIGPFFRLPGYRSLAELFWIAIDLRLIVIEADLFFLASGGADFVGAAHAFGLKVFGFTATNAAEWRAFELLEVDGIYVDNVPEGVALQPESHSETHSCSRWEGRRARLRHSSCR